MDRPEATKEDLEREGTRILISAKLSSTDTDGQETMIVRDMQVSLDLLAEVLRAKEVK